MLKASATDGSQGNLVHGVTANTCEEHVWSIIDHRTCKFCKFRLVQTTGVVNVKRLQCRLQPSLASCVVLWQQLLQYY